LTHPIHIIIIIITTPPPSTWFFTQIIYYHTRASVDQIRAKLQGKNDVSFNIWH